ncbi:hypothetical protein KA005_20700, partial [bacterium]|nr:hypothetical protein [bacterium]
DDIDVSLQDISCSFVLSMSEVGKTWMIRIGYLLLRQLITAAPFDKKRYIREKVLEVQTFSWNNTTQDSL